MIAGSKKSSALARKAEPRGRALHGPREALNFRFHRLAEPFMAFGQFVERPVEVADGVRGLEDGQCEAVAYVLEFSKCRIPACEDRCRGRFGIAQGIGNTMRCKRIAEEAGIADKQPAGAICLPQSPRHTSEGLETIAGSCLGDVVAGWEPARPGPTAQRKIETELGVEPIGRNGGDETGKTVIRRDHPTADYWDRNTSDIRKAAAVGEHSRRYAPPSSVRSRGAVPSRLRATNEPNSVSSDHNVCPNLPGSAGGIPQCDAADAAIRISKVVHGPKCRAGPWRRLTCGIDQHAVEQACGEARSVPGSPARDGCPL